MNGFAAKIVAAWYQQSLWLWLLAPLSLIYLVLTRLRRFGFQRGLFYSWRGPVPVIVVGNIAVGGTGKTPLVIALAQALVAAGYRPGIASRGYGGHPPVTPWSVTTDGDVAACGDEPVLLANRTGLPVVIDPDRAGACQCLIDQHGCNVIVTDDGLQHYRLQRDIEIVVVDGRRALGNGRVLPMGPLRESPSRLRDSDFMVVNGADKVPSVAHQNTYAMTICATSLVAIDTAERVTIGQWPHQTTVHAVAGIGNPGRFFTSLRESGFTPIEHEFADHHVFNRADLQFDDNLPVIMTEKDAVKCRHFQLPGQYWFLSVDANLSDGFFAAILQRLHSLFPDIVPSSPNRREAIKP